MIALLSLGLNLTSCSGDPKAAGDTQKPYYTEQHSLHLYSDGGSIELLGGSVSGVSGSWYEESGEAISALVDNSPPIVQFSFANCPLGSPPALG